MSENRNILGVCGLRNIGNTCYMNSSLQCLIATPILSGYLVKKKFTDILKMNIIKSLSEKSDNEEVENSEVKKKYDNSLTYNLYQLIKTVWHEQAVVVPKTFKEKLVKVNNNFMGNRQHDSEEFLRCVLDTIHEETKQRLNPKLNGINKDLSNYIVTFNKYKKQIQSSTDEEEKQKLEEESIKLNKENPNYMIQYKGILNELNCKVKNNSIISELFTYITTNEIKCTKCNNVSVSFSDNTILPLNIPSSGESTLDECFKNMCQEELLNNDNQYACGVCNEKTDAIKRTKLWNTSEYLIVQLCRFINVGMRCMKIDSNINFPIENLDLNNYKSEFSLYENDKYELYGVVQHMGSLNGGHYISYTKNPISNIWYEYNDSSVQQIPNDKINEEIQNNRSYILFYKRMSSENFDESEETEE